MLILLRLLLSVSLVLSGATVVAAEPKSTVACTRPGNEVATGERKFHPGHYAAVGRAEAGNLKAAAATRGVEGVQRRYRWAQLEPVPGSYDVAPIARDLELMADAGVQLVAMIEDKSFDGTIPTPSYLHDKRTLRGQRGFVANRWDPYVVDRLIKLVAVIGDNFDCHPNFEGIAFQETALSLDPATLQGAGYTPEKYRDSQVRLLTGAAAHVPRSRVFWYMNFFPGNQGYLGDIASAVAGSGVVMGGPDVLPDNTALAQRVYPLYDRFQGRMKLFGSMQHDSYRHRRGPDSVSKTGSASSDLWSMEDLFLFARDQLHVDYVFWEYRSHRNPPSSHDWNEARNVIASYSEFGPGRSRGGK